MRKFAIRIISPQEKRTDEGDPFFIYGKRFVFASAPGLSAPEIQELADLLSATTPVPGIVTNYEVSLDMIQIQEVPTVYERLLDRKSKIDWKEVARALSFEKQQLQRAYRSLQEQVQCGQDREEGKG